MKERNLKNVQGMSKRDTVNYMLSNLLPSMADVHGGTNLTLPFACGKTRVYFRAGALEHLETMRLDYYTSHTVAIQRWIRNIHARCQFMRMKETAIKMQALARCRMEMQRYRRQKAAVLSLQCWCRGEKAKATLKELRFIRFVIKIQSRQVLCVHSLLLLPHFLTDFIFHSDIDFERHGRGGALCDSSVLRCLSSTPFEIERKRLP
jgi:hypothetical protein